MAEKKPKITVDAYGTIHVDGDDSEPKTPGKKHVEPTASNIDPDGTIHMSSSSSKPKTASGKQTTKQAGKKTDVTPADNYQENTELSGKEPRGFFKTIIDGALTLVCGFLAILLLGGVCAGIGLLVMNGLGMIPLVIFIFFIVMSVLGGSGKSQ